MTVQLTALKKLVEKRMAAQRRRRLSIVRLSGGFEVRKDGTKLLIYHSDEPDTTEICGAVSPDGEWQMWPLWYEVLAEELGPMALAEETEEEAEEVA